MKPDEYIWSIIKTFKSKNLPEYKTIVLRVAESGHEAVTKERKSTRILKNKFDNAKITCILANFNYWRE